MTAKFLWDTRRKASYCGGRECIQFCKCSDSSFQHAVNEWRRNIANWETHALKEKRNYDIVGNSRKAILTYFSIFGCSVLCNRSRRLVRNVCDSWIRKLRRCFLLQKFYFISSPFTLPRSFRDFECARHRQCRNRYYSAEKDNTKFCVFRSKPN